MFIKPYRIPVSTNSAQNRKILFQKDLTAMPEGIWQSLTDHYRDLNMQLVPVLRKATGISFQYSGSYDYLIRDIGYSTHLIKSLLDSKFKQGFNNKTESIFQRISAVNKFITNVSSTNNSYSMLLDLNNKTNYDKSIVIGLKPYTDSIHDIEYVDIFYDTNSDVVICNKPFSKKADPETLQRVGISLRVYLEDKKSSYSVLEELTNCVYSGDDGEHHTQIKDATNVYYSQFILESTEYHFSCHCDNIDDLIIAYLEGHLELLSNRMGYPVTTVTKEILDVIDMSLI
jgi:hypothetical protein